MKSQRLDISIESLNNELLVVLEGIFFDEQIASVQQKFESLIDDGHKVFIVDLHHCEIRAKEITVLFLDLMNNLKGRGGKLVLLMNSDKRTAHFTKWGNLFFIYQSIQEYQNSGFVKNLKKRGIIYSKKTGLRLSPGIAVLLVVLMGGWLLTLISIIRFQDQGLDEQNKYIYQLETQKEKMIKDITELQIKLAPLKDLGLINDSLESANYTFISDWVDYLKVLEKRRPLSKESEKPE